MEGLVRLSACGLRFRLWLSALCFLVMAIFHDLSGNRVVACLIIDYCLSLRGWGLGLKANGPNTRAGLKLQSTAFAPGLVFLWSSSAGR